VPVVFAQKEDGVLPLDALGRSAELHFGLMLSSSPAIAAANTASSCVRLEVVSPDATAAFVVWIRPSTPEDVDAALVAEQRGNAAGMGALAARCKALWVVETQAGSPEWLLWECCAVLAFAALGPILPDDHSTLFGVRSARALALRLRTAAPP
jgi:hypothetical protein